MKALIGRKIGMTRAFAEDGTVTPVTVIQAGPCTVVQRKVHSRDGYDAVQLSYGQKKHPNRPAQGHYKKAGIAPGLVAREVRVEVDDELESGSTITVDVFRPGELVKVTGRSRGRGFAGGTKKWGFHGGDDAHGCKSHRTPGSMGSNTKPGRTFKGRKMPGRMGNTPVTVRNLRVVRVDSERNLIMLHGAVPGARNGFVMILALS
ncbi:MAG: 50S ribosomal protein L3 [Candidatus Eisenbacteria bacterium]|jgi:large subunit ribosomal protein L3|nr:50S ribosomal protein L3 [Candidatus Eisenbacteria bacterium]